MNADAQLLSFEPKPPWLKRWRWWIVAYLIGMTAIGYLFGEGPARYLEHRKMLPSGWRAALYGSPFQNLVRHSGLEPRYSAYRGWWDRLARRHSPFVTTHTLGARTYRIETDASGFGRSELSYRQSGRIDFAYHFKTSRGLTFESNRIVFADMSVDPTRKAFSPLPASAKKITIRDVGGEIEVVADGVPIAVRGLE